MTQNKPSPSSKASHHHDEEEEIVVTGEEVPFADAIAATPDPSMASNNDMNITVVSEDAGKLPPHSSMVTIIAPSTLSEGYKFPATVDGKEFTITVPHGGVKEGQQFQVPYPTEEVAFLTSSTAMVTTTGPPNLPEIKGRWKNGLCDCCETFCSGLFWMACCCNGFLFGQLLQRMHRDPFGGATNNWTHTCRYVSIAFGIYMILQFAGIGEVVSIIWLIYILIAGTLLRYSFRKRYEIKPSCCDCMDGKMDDCCCSCWCLCCMTIQMARHTHNEDQYPYMCCTATGLPLNAPECV